MDKNLDQGNIGLFDRDLCDLNPVKWPKDSKFAVCLTHDVDRTKKTYQYFSGFFKDANLRSLSSIINSKKDPYWQFPSIMELEESYNVRSTFFFLNETLPFGLFKPNNWKLSLGRYKIKSKKIIEIIRELDNKGWEIGLHGSIRSYNNPKLLLKEKLLLERILGHKIMGTRQHYLNLEIPKTWQIHRLLGLKYDASFGYKKGIGYKENLHFPFFPFKDSFMAIPLPLMDSFLISGRNDYQTYYNKVISIINEAEAQGGLLTVLWHQSSFNSIDFPHHKRIYCKLIEECQKRNAWFGTCKEIYNHIYEGRKS